MALDFGSQGFGGGTGLGLVVGLGLALGAGLVQGSGICRGCQVAREQEVAGVTVRNFMNLIFLADGLDVLFENIFIRVSLPKFLSQLPRSIFLLRRAVKVDLFTDAVLRILQRAVLELSTRHHQMAATAQRFQNDLYVQCAHAAG